MAEAIDYELMARAFGKMFKENGRYFGNSNSNDNNNQNRRPESGGYGSIKAAKPAHLKSDSNVSGNMLDFNKIITETSNSLLTGTGATQKSFQSLVNVIDTSVDGLSLTNEQSDKMLDSIKAHSFAFLKDAEHMRDVAEAAKKLSESILDDQESLKSWDAKRAEAERNKQALEKLAADNAAFIGPLTEEQAAAVEAVNLALSDANKAIEEFSVVNKATTEQRVIDNKRELAEAAKAVNAANIKQTVENKIYGSMGEFGRIMQGTNKAGGLFLLGLTMLVKGITQGWNDYRSMLKDGMGAYFADTQKYATQMGVSVEFLSKTVKSNARQIAVMSGGAGEYLSRLNETQNQLSYLGLSLEDTAKAAADFTTGAVKMGVNIGDKGAMSKAIKQQAESFKVLNATTDVTMDQFIEMNNDLMNSREVQAQLLGLSQQDRAERMNTINGLRQNLVNLGLGAKEAQAMVKTFQALTGETVKSRYEQAIKTQQAAMLMGMGADEAAGMAATIRKGRRASQGELTALATSMGNLRGNMDQFAGQGDMQEALVNTLDEGMAGAAKELLNAGGQLKLAADAQMGITGASAEKKGKDAEAGPVAQGMIAAQDKLINYLKTPFGLIIGGIGLIIASIIASNASSVASSVASAAASTGGAALTGIRVIMGALSSMAPMLLTVAGVVVGVAAIIYGLFGAFKGWQDAGKTFETETATIGQKITSAIGGFFKALLPDDWADSIDSMTRSLYDAFAKGWQYFKKYMHLLSTAGFGDTSAEDAEIARLNSEAEIRDRKVAEKTASKESAKASKEAGGAAKDATTALKQSSADQLGLTTLQTENARTVNDQYLSATASKVNVPGAINTPASTTPSSDSTTASSSSSSSSSTSATKTIGSSPTDIVGALNTLIKIAQDQLTELQTSAEYAAKIAKQSNISAFANVTNKNALVRQSG